MKQTIRLTESEFRTMVQETVNEVLNKSNSVFYNYRPSRITKMDRSNSSKKHTFTSDENEPYSDAQYAHLAGQANGAVNDLRNSNSMLNTAFQRNK